MDEFAGLDRGWNDPDMMVIGKSGIKTTMSKSHMALWCMMNSPIMLGFDLSTIERGDEIYNIVANKDLLDLNQDPLGIQVKRIYSSIATTADRGPDVTFITDINRIDVIAKPLANGDVALTFVNTNTTGNKSASVDVGLILDYIGQKMPVGMDAAFGAANKYSVKEYA